MKTTTEYLNAAKAAINAPSDYALAKWLGVTKQAIYGYRAGRTTIDDYTAVKIADAIGIDPLEVIAAANMEREKDAKRKELWRKVYSRCTAARLMFSCVFSGTYRIDGKAGTSSLSDNAIYIMRSAARLSRVIRRTAAKRLNSLLRTVKRRTHEKSNTYSEHDFRILQATA